MGTYRRKPLEVQAVRWSYGFAVSPQLWPDWLRAAYEAGAVSLEPLKDKPLCNQLRIENHEGVCRAGVDQYVLLLEGGGIYVEEARSFEAVFSLVRE